MSGFLGQQIIVEDKPGASGGVGAQMVATSPPDGYTLLLSPTAILAITPFARKVPYNPDDLVAVSRLSTPILVVTLTNALGVKTWAEFVALAKQRSRQVLVRLLGPRHHHASHRRGADARRRHPDAALALQDHRRRHRRRVRRPHPDGLRSLLHALCQGGQGARRDRRRAGAAGRPARHADRRRSRARPQGFPRPAAGSACLRRRARRSRC